jgi:TRAP-type C4-dicarboxylate transport system substrate-binding protein
MPMAFKNLAEVDYVGKKLRPMLEARMAAKGYRVLFWTDSGWARIFSTSRVVHPDDLRKLKVFCWAGTPKELDIWKAAGFEPVPLEAGAIPQALLSRTISAVPMPPLYANPGRLDSQAKYMIELNWGALVGAAVVRTKSWERVPADVRESLLTIASETGEQVTAAARAENDAAVTAMQKRGLQVQKVTPELDEEWRQVIDKVQNQIRGGVVPADVFDEAQRALKEYRSK